MPFARLVWQAQNKPDEHVSGTQDWVCQHVGALFWAVEIWASIQEAGIKDYKSIDLHRDHPPEDDLKHAQHAPKVGARAELGYVLSRTYWGGGYLYEALTGLIDHAFGQTALRRLEAEIYPRNITSATLLRLVGFVQEGLLRQHWLTKRTLVDAALYGLLRDDWLLQSGH